MKQVIQDVNANAIDSLTGYLLSIDWEEPWLWGLMAFHVLCGVLTSGFLLFNYYRPQVVLFVLYLTLAYSSEYINEWAANNYKKFSKQQYFDSQGMFISLMLSFPLLINSIVIVVFWMWDVLKTMIGLKRAKVTQQRRRRKESEKPRSPRESTSDDKDQDENKAVSEPPQPQEPEKSETEKKVD